MMDLKENVPFWNQPPSVVFHLHLLLTLFISIVFRQQKSHFETFSIFLGFQGYGKTSPARPTSPGTVFTAFVENAENKKYPCHAHIFPV